VDALTDVCKIVALPR